MDLSLFLTYGNSLHTWQRAGILERELALYMNHAGAGVGITIISYGNQKDLALIESYSSIRVICNRWRLPTWLYSLLLPFVHRKELDRSDILKTNQMYGAHVAFWCAHVLGKKLYLRQGYSLVDHLESSRKLYFLWKFLANKYEKFLVTRSDLVTCTTDEMLQSVTGRNPLFDGVARVVPNYVDQELWSPLYQTEKENNPIRLVFFGRFEKQKNLEALIEAAMNLEVEVTLIGDGPLLDRLKELATECAVTCHFPGRLPQEEVLQTLRKSDVFVLPSHYEGHPKALIEAMSAGLPVIVSDSPGIREQVKHYVTGIVVPATVNGFRNGIYEFLRMSSDDKAMLGKKGSEWVVERFALAKVAESERDLITAICWTERSH
jgi:glycosyltransferase involved in cell wall biosynthesis